MMRWLMTTMLMLTIVLPGATAQAALVADLDQKEVQISTDFNGAELLLFGALKLQDDDGIAIVVSGPPKSVAVRRKDKVAGIWINTESATLVGIPSFYHILSTHPIDDIALPLERQKTRLGYNYIPFKLQSGSRIDEGDDKEWREALHRNMEANGLWGKDVGDVRMLENALFRTNVVLPANIHPGQYEVRILHFRDGIMINEEISMIDVVKSGLSSGIYNVAHSYAPFYGIFAIVFAVGAGWLAAVAFRR